MRPDQIDQVMQIQTANVQALYLEHNGSGLERRDLAILVEERLETVGDLATNNHEVNDESNEGGFNKKDQSRRVAVASLPLVEEIRLSCMCTPKQIGKED